MSPTQPPDATPPGGLVDRQGPGGGRPASDWGMVCLGIRSEGQVAPLLDRVAAAMAAQGYPERDVLDVRRALGEALANALQHGHQGDPAGGVAVRCHVSAGRVLAEVGDPGLGFDPTGGPDPLAPQKSSGRGPLRDENQGHTVTVCKHRSPA
jgi:anti-sigma regulatory factor (Ser/Thr protein kinase)